MDAASKISKGALTAIYNDPDNAPNNYPVPVLQCLQVSQLRGQSGAADHYRVVLSDINHFIRSVLATQVNHLVRDQILVENCIIRLTQYRLHASKGRTILVILGLEVISDLGQPAKIGTPVVLPLSSTTETSANETIEGQNFYGAKKEETKPKPAMAPARNQGAASHEDGNITFIDALSPYAHKWTIKARVTSKSDIRKWHSPKEGKLFSVNLLDESGEIKATGFNDQCDAFFPVLQDGAVYYISSPCKVNFANKKFNHLPNTYELIFEQGTVIRKAENQSSVPQISFNFCNIQELQSVEKDATVDVIGVLKEIGELEPITSKTTQKSYDKRELSIVDDSGFSVRVTIWGKTAQSLDAQLESVIAFRGVKVSDFGGRSLSLLSSGTMAVDPDIPDAHRLKGWYDSAGRNGDFNTHVGMGASLAGATGQQYEDKFVNQIKEEQLGMSEKMDRFNLKATIVYIKPDTFAYPACRTEKCNKKVTDMEDGTWRCEKCDISHDRPEYRYIMSVNICDHTGALWLNCFDEAGRSIMGMSADKLMELKESGDDAQVAAAFEEANCKKLLFQCGAKMDHYDQMTRPRYQAQRARPLDYKLEADKLADLIKQYEMS